MHDVISNNGGKYDVFKVHGTVCVFWTSANARAFTSNAEATQGHESVTQACVIQSGVAFVSISEDQGRIQDFSRGGGVKRTKQHW